MEIWLALLVAPVLALADQLVAYAAVGASCAHGQVWALHAVHAGFLLGAMCTSWPAWRQWRATRGTSDQGARARHFLARMAIASAWLSALVVAAMWVPTWFISPCAG